MNGMGRDGTMDGQAGAAGASPRGDGRASAKQDVFEWIAGGVSAVLTLAMIGFIGWQALTADEGIPRLTVEIQAVEPVAGGWHVRFRAVNTGDATAANVAVEGQLKSGGTVVETGEGSIDYVPANSAHSGGMFFSRNPAEHEMAIRARGYQVP